MKPFLLLVVAATAPCSNGFAPPSSSNKPRTLLNSVPNSFDTLTSGLASIARIKYGVSVSPKGISNGPVAKASIKKLYDIENDRECRRVRERITELDLVVENVIPACEKSRARVATVPTMVVEIEGKEKTLEGSSAILASFDNEFELESIPAEQSVDELLSYFPGILRAGRGTNVCGAASSSLNVSRPEKPLVLYSYEGNQFCRLVREVLTELDIVYELRSAGKGSPRREELASTTGGSSQCPYLIDPNTDIKMPESKDIIVYLYKQYADFTPPNELLKSVSGIVTPILAPVYKIIAPLQAGSRRENEVEYNSELADAKAKIDEEIASAPVVICKSVLSVSGVQ
jgi:anaphase-promoting complex subunit 7